MLRKSRISAEALIKEPENTLFSMLKQIKIEDIKEEALLSIFDYLIPRDLNKALSLLNEFKIPEAKTAAIAKIVKLVSSKSSKPISSKPDLKYIDMLKECMKDIQLAEIAIETLLESSLKQSYELALELLDTDIMKQDKIRHALLRAKCLIKLGKNTEAKESLDFLSSEIRMKKSNLCKYAEQIYEVAKGYISLGLIGDATILVEFASRKIAKDIANSKNKNSENVLEMVNDICELAILSKKRRFVDLALELKDEIEKGDSDLFTLCEIESTVAETFARLGEKDDAVTYFKNSISRLGDSIQIEHELEIKSCADAIFSHALRSAESKDDKLLEDIFGNEEFDWTVANSFTVIESMLVLAKRCKDYELIQKAIELSKRHSWKKRVCAMLMISELFADFGDEKLFCNSFNDALSNIPFQIFKKEEIDLAWKESIGSAVNSLNAFEEHKKKCN
ncbi:MAG: hypothetical protein QXT63_06800 [Thermoplasmata archaeon]